MLYDQSPVIAVFEEGSSECNVKIWSGTATTIGGVATFHPTDNGQLDGNALIDHIHSSQVTAGFDTATPTEVPVASIKLISSDKKTVTVNCIRGKTLIALGVTVEFVPDGTTVFLTLIGC